MYTKLKFYLLVEDIGHFFLFLEFPTAEILGSFILILHNFVYWKRNVEKQCQLML